MDRQLRPAIYLMVVSLLAAALGNATGARAEQQHSGGSKGKSPRTAVGSKPGAPTRIEKVTVSYPHGGWWDNRYVYTPDVGFGRSGVYSWYYGQPYAFSYPYTYYGMGVSTTLGPGGTLYTALPAWQRVSPGGARSAYANFWFGGPQVNAFPVWASMSPAGGYAGTQGFGAYQPWTLPSVGVVNPPAIAADAYAAGYWQAAVEAERKRREPWASVTLQIDPPGAALYVDGNPIGSAEQFDRPGARLSLPAGDYHLEITAPGYETLSLDLKLAQGEVRRIERELSKSAPKAPRVDNSKSDKESSAPARPRGEVFLVVSPADARVTIDGRFACRISASGEEFRCRLSAGPHVMEVSKDGHQTHREEVIVSPLQPLAREVRLKAR